MDEPVMVELKGVVKRFGNVTVLDHVNICFARGQIHGIIGRNGSGKTVLLKTICGFLRPEEGTVRVDGKDVRFQAPLQNIGIIIEAPGFVPGLSGMKNLEMLASLRGVVDRERLRDVIRSVGLDPED